MAIKKSVSGIRATVGDDLTPELITSVAGAFAAYLKKGTVVVGRDSRPTGEAISRAFTSALNLAGIDVVDIGLVPTPTVQYVTEQLQASGGVVITASHNPVEWNAFKLINGDGTFLNEKQMKRLLQLMEKPRKWVSWKYTGSYRKDESLAMSHVDDALKLVDIAKIRRKKFRVVLDSVNGAGSIITQELLKRLGCSVLPLYCTPGEPFPRVAEPLPEHLGDLSAAVKKYNAHLGIAQDPDADRLALVDETGTPMGEEYTITAVAAHLLRSAKGRVVVNLSTTRAVEDVAKAAGVPFTRAKVGEINVVDVMRKKDDILIGGEGNGGVIDPALHLGRDSLVGIVRILDMMASEKRGLSEIKKTLPQYVMRKYKIKVSDDLSYERLYEMLKKDFAKERISTLDGIRIDFREQSRFPGTWVHLRASNTEPAFRIICEGRDEKTAKAVEKYFIAYVKDYAG